MLDALLAFREAHRAAWLRFREGLDAVFPPGTWMDAARAAVAAGHGSFVGVDKAKRYSVWHATSRPKGRKAGRNAESRRRVDAATRGRLSAMLDALLAFREAHRAAWLRFREGLDAVFPPGTWMAWRYYGARRHDPSPPATTAPS